MQVLPGRVADARARRRFAEQRAGGGGADLDAIRAAIAARDDADRTRSVAPLAQSADATYVDSSDMTVDEVVELMAKEVGAGVLYAILKRLIAGSAASCSASRWSARTGCPGRAGCSWPRTT